MKNHLDKKTIDKLKKSKENKVLSGNLIKKESYVKHSTIRE